MNDIKETISYNEFKKLDLRVVSILNAERVQGSEKLIKLIVDLGGERNIIAGIGKTYSPEDLIGKQIVILANLEPKKLMGEESNGMLLAAIDEEMPVLIIPDKKIGSGSVIQ